MIIKKMTASFGKLTRATLELHEGLNIISAPNESGKTTWTEFLLAMFYGVDTGERQKLGGPIPVKERCRPWSGAPMEGSLEVDDITLSRSSGAHAPMGVFRAYYTESGLTVPGLSAANCAQTLLGAERSVFERSAFIRRSSLAVTKDSSLEQRLGALVTTGDDGMSYTEAAQALHNLTLRCARSKTGLIAKTEETLAGVEQKLQAIYALQEQLSELEAENSSLLHEQTQLHEAAAALEAMDVARKREQLQLAQDACQKAAQDARQLDAVCAALPPRETLTQLASALEAQTARLQTAQLEAALCVRTLAQPPVPPVFSGLTPDEAAAQAAADAAALEAAQTPPPKRGRLLPVAAIALFALALILGIWLFTVQPPYALFGLLPALAGCACLCVLFAGRKRDRQAAEAAAQSAQLLLARYGASDFRALAAKYADETETYRQQKAAADAECARCDAALADSLQAQQALTAEISAFAPDCTDAADCRRALDAAQKAYTSLSAAQRELTQAQLRFDALQQAIGTLGDVPEADIARWRGCDPAQLQRKRAQLTTQLLSVRSRLDQGQGRLAALGEPLSLAAQKEQLTQRLSELRFKNDALQLASEALDEANRTLQSRFSPLLCKTAGAIFSRLTGGAYEKLLLSSSFEATALPTGDTVLRPAQALSCGTVDQLYLAVRLAIAELLLPQGVPLILDDALLAFDDARAALAMQVLREQAQTRQILLFTCHSREQSL